MADHLEELLTVYELALRRLRSFSDDRPVLSDAAVERLAALQQTAPELETESPPEISYARGLAIARLALFGYTSSSVGDADRYEQDALEAVYQYLNGPMWEAAHELDEEASAPTEGTVLMLRDSTRELLSVLVDAEVLPPAEDLVLEVFDPDAELPPEADAA